MGRWVVVSFLFFFFFEVGGEGQARLLGTARPGCSQGELAHQRHQDGPRSWEGVQEELAVPAEGDRSLLARTREGQGQQCCPPATGTRPASPLDSTPASCPSDGAPPDARACPSAARRSSPQAVEEGQEVGEGRKHPVCHIWAATAQPRLRHHLPALTEALLLLLLLPLGPCNPPGGQAIASQGTPKCRRSQTECGGAGGTWAGAAAPPRSTAGRQRPCHRRSCCRRCYHRRILAVRRTAVGG